MSVVTQIQRLQQAKSDIIDALQDKGVSVPAGVTMGDFPELILKIGEEDFGLEPTYTSYIIDQTPIMKDGVVVGYPLPEETIIGRAAKDSDETVTLNGVTTYKNVIRRIRANTHAYISRIENNEQQLWQLSDNDFNYLKDGTTQRSTIYNSQTDDIVIRLPKFWWKIEALDENENRLKVSFCMSEDDIDETWNLWDEKTCIGVYPAVNSTGAITTTEGDFDNYYYSQPGRTILSVTPEDCKTKAHNYDSGGQPMDYECYQMIALLTWGWYSSTDTFLSVGTFISSFTHGNYSDYSPSTTDNYGMEDTADTVIENQWYYNKIWGFENWGEDTLVPFTVFSGLVSGENEEVSVSIKKNNEDTDVITASFTSKIDSSLGIIVGNTVKMKLCGGKYLVPTSGSTEIVQNRLFSSYCFYENETEQASCVVFSFGTDYNSIFYNIGRSGGIFGTRAESTTDPTPTRLVIRPKSNITVTLMN